MNHNYKGMFVTFEGLDFSGKSIQVKLLEKYSRSLGFNVVSHREPGGTLVGERIRNILLDKKNMGMCNETELLLFNAARGQYAQDLLIPALKRGDIFLSDRFYDSTTAYQGYGRGVHLDAIKLINEHDEVVVEAIGGKMGRAKGDIPGIRWQVIKVNDQSLDALLKGKIERGRR